MNNNHAIYKDIVLIGGGHAHALVIKMWGMKPIPGVRITLISDQAHTPYSGMLPGLVSGHYNFKETHIDLFKLCSWAKVRFICNTVHSLNPDKKSISLHGRPNLNYDILSINTGSTPNIHNTPGAALYASAVKPIAQFFSKWQQIKQRLKSSTHSLNIALVGAGAGGFELLMAMHYATQHNTKPANTPRHQFHWIISGCTVLDGHNQKVQTQAIALCETASIELHFNFRVESVTDTHIIKEENDRKETHSLENNSIKVDEIIWCTAAAASLWPKNAGLAVDDKNFIAINDHLQSTSHPDIFAVGDVATQINHPRPKAGVFAVRQGPTLYKNLCRSILKQPLKEHRPQAQFLSLLATGNKHAIASRGGLYIQGKWVWKWKNHIDNKFMNMLKQFPPMKTKRNISISSVLSDEHTQSLDQKNSPYTSLTEIMRCGGCGAKVSSNVLSSTLKKVTQDIHVIPRDDVLIGLDSPDDAAVIDTHNQALAQSVDQFRSLIDDPYLFARIATNHSLSDLHAMASTPQSALSIVAMPYASDVILQRELYQLTYGVIEELNKAGCSLTGGHTSEAAELSLGLCVNGLVDKNSIKTKTGIKNDERLIITKPLGTGVIMAAHMQQKADGNDVLNCLNTMLQSNQKAAEIFKQFQCSAMTDITGFGLIGHLLETLKDSAYSCHINLSSIPLLPGALALSKQGVKSTLFDKNAQAQQYIDNYDKHKKSDAYPLLFDPQTSGGLMAWVSAANSINCVQELTDAGYEAHIIARLSNDRKHAGEASKIIIA